jgi:muramoyltetrapeptide carboxypeptidase
VALTPRTRAGLVKCRPVSAGSRVALVAPASPFAREEFDAGLVELRLLGLEPVYDDRVFERQGFLAGSAAVRAASLAEAMTTPEVDAVMAVRGGYGSVELLPLLDIERLISRRTAFIGYSDLTTIHTVLNRAGSVSIHGPMLEGRIARGAERCDVASLLGSLSPHPMGELSAERLETVNAGEVVGPLFGGTLTQLCASLGTPYAFDPLPGAVLFLEDVGERPYRLHRLLTQLRLSGRLQHARAIILGELPQCDEPNGGVTAAEVVAEVLSEFPGPVVRGFPSGHTTSPFVTLPFGVDVRVVAPAGGSARVVVEEAAAA